jgi:hypothetical protein
MDTDHPPSILRKSTKDPSTASPEKKKPRGRPRGSSISGDKSRSGSKVRSASKPRSGSKPRSKTPQAKRSQTPKGSKKPAEGTKKTPTKNPPSFADKLKTPVSPKKPIKRLQDRAFVSGLLSMSKTSRLRQEVYAKISQMLVTCHAVQGESTRGF